MKCDVKGCRKKAVNDVPWESKTFNGSKIRKVTVYPGVSFSIFLDIPAGKGIAHLCDEHFEERIGKIPETVKVARRKAARERRKEGK